MSPPCPPWSLASLQQGLYKDEGRLSLHAYGLVNLLRPKIVLMEMVAGMKDHPHWGIIREFMIWCGYSLRYYRCSNLMEVSPQQRERLIILATKDQAQLFPHLPVGWPAIQQQTLHSYLNILYDLDEPWKSQTELSDDLLCMYLNPDMLPKMMNRQSNSPKRTKRDLESYRVRFPHGSVGCIIANYGFGHLLPETTLKHGFSFRRHLWHRAGYHPIIVHASECWAMQLPLHIPYLDLPMSLLSSMNWVVLRYMRSWLKLCPNA